MRVRYTRLEWMGARSSYSWLLGFDRLLTFNRSRLAHIKQVRQRSAWREQLIGIARVEKGSGYRAMQSRFRPVNHSATAKQ